MPTPADAQNTGRVMELGALQVVGSRVAGRSAQDSLVPVDVIQGEDLQTYGIRDMDSLLSATVPSYNVNQQPISDAATLVRPANLRGLPADSTLVLVNGKRRHRASVITFLGNGISDGSQAPDVSVIPAIALDRVEVLRDGAAAQYGSDAIAGILNFRLREDREGLTVQTSYGQNYHGDGDKVNVAANLGLPLTDSGFASAVTFFGAQALAPKKSVNHPVGLVSSLADVAVTVDYYRIKMQDAGSHRTRQHIQCCRGARKISSLRFHTRDFDTTTQGVMS